MIAYNNLKFMFQHNREYLMKTAEVHDKLAQLKALHSSKWYVIEPETKEIINL